MLLNVGPRSDGTLRPLDIELLRCIGRWTEIYREATYLPRPTDIAIADKPKDFVLKREDTYYLFCHGLGMAGDGNAVMSGAHAPSRLTFDTPVRRVTWLDNGREVPFEQQEGVLTVRVSPFPYGTNLVVRVAKIEV
jgi:alpha-L-fucosidase